jgi:signal transduction histidine kinase
MDKIFEKYYRTGKSKAEGNGLGLAICKRICDLSGGEITATSTLGKGSTFKVKLPKVQG